MRLTLDPIQDRTDSLGIVMGLVDANVSEYTGRNNRKRCNGKM